MAVDPIAAENFRALGQVLSDLGLQQLFTVAQDGTPGGWLWEKIQQGIDTPEELRAHVEATDIWRNRYAVILAQRERAAKGEPVHVMTETEVREYETGMAQRMKAYGLPGWFYDQPSDFHDLILNGLSQGEVEDRIKGAFNTVRNMDPTITAKFREFYGVAQGDAALASFFLDPNKTAAQLNKVADASYAAGLAQGYGMQLSKDRAEMYALTDATHGGIAQDMATINAMGDQLQEGFTETDSLTADDAFDAVVMGDAKARARLEGRIAVRKAGDRAGAGGALMTQEGLTGLGTAG